jgi:hypothetical protein
LTYTLELPVAFTIIAGLGTVMALAASAAAFYKTRLNKDTIDVLSENNKALSERVDILSTSVETLTEDNRELRLENSTLRSLVTADKAINELTAATREGHEKILSAIASRCDTCPQA